MSNLTWSNSTWSNPAWDINPEHAADAIAIEQLLDDVMGPTRRARGVYQLRRQQALDLGMSFIARDAGQLIASIRFWPVPDAPQSRLLGPLVVHRAYQRCGVGTALVAAGIRAAEAANVARIFVVGSPEFYARMGFQSPTADVEWVPEPVDRSQILVWARPCEKTGYQTEKVSVRWRYGGRFSVLLATNSRRQYQARERARAKAA